jgi:hypothetical protein
MKRFHRTASFEVTAGNGPSVVGTLIEVAKKLNEWIKANPEAIAKMLLWLQEQEDKGGAERDRDGRSFYELILPANWRTLRAAVLERAQRLMVETGLCLVWVPNAEVIEALVQAPNKAARDQELVHNADSILEDIEGAGEEVLSPHLADLKAGLAQGVDAFRLGLSMPAQAMSAAIVTTILEGHYGFERFGQARRAFGEEHPDEVGLWSSRRASIHWGLRTAILNKQQRPTDGGFSRHSTAHDVGGGQYSQSKALEALLLAAGSLRELQETYWLAERGYVGNYPLRPLAEKTQQVQNSLRPA